MVISPQRYATTSLSQITCKQGYKVPKSQIIQSYIVWKKKDDK